MRERIDSLLDILRRSGLTGKAMWVLYVALVLFPCWAYRTWGTSIGFNLVVEIWGILVTVLCVSQWAKRREQQRLLALKHRLWSDLFSVTERLLCDILPQQFWRPDATHYQYGNRLVPSAIQLDYEMLSDADLPVLFRPLAKRYEKGFESLLDKTVLPAKIDIDDIVLTFRDLFDPELRNSVLLVRQQLEPVPGLLIVADNGKDGPHRWTCAVGLGNLLHATILLRRQLEELADRRLTRQESAEILADTRELITSLRPEKDQDSASQEQGTGEHPT